MFAKHDIVMGNVLRLLIDLAKVRHILFKGLAMVVSCITRFKDLPRDA